MRIEIPTLFSGYLLILNINATQSQQKCTVKDLNASCNKQQLPDIPNDLPANIETMDLSNTYIDALTDVSFNKYQTLKVLIMESALINHSHSVRFLEPLKNLEIVSLGSAIINGIEIESLQFPSSIRSLNLSRQPISEFDDHYKLPNLETILLVGNSLKFFPKISHKAPLKRIDLDYNLLINITVEDIIPFCRLAVLSANQQLWSKATNKNEYCQCYRLAKWIKEHNIRAYIGECKFPGKVQCDKNYDPKLMAEYNECIKTKPPESHSLIYVLVVLFLLLVILAALIVRFVYKRSQTEGEDTTKEDD